MCGRDSTVQSTTDSRTNFYLDGNGNLVITLTYDSAIGQYDSARLTVAGKYEIGPYGQIESRLITPGALGSGAAFWALSSAILVAQNITGTSYKHLRLQLAMHLDHLVKQAPTNSVNEHYLSSCPNCVQKKLPYPQ